MNYISTRDKNMSVSSAQAIAQGISFEGGLFVPEMLPKLPNETLKTLIPLTYQERAKQILSYFLTDFTSEELSDYVDKAYTAEKFEDEKIAPLVKLSPDRYLLELWHGPTCAFKDMALQLLPHLLTGAAKKALDNQKIAILVATSGDTGKAALEGFKDVEGTEILVFYPQDGVSPMQKRQMTTQEGQNVGVFGITGNFDDAQTGVKQLFTNPDLAKHLADNKIVFSSANSINWGRLVPQIVYYFSAYSDMVADEEIAFGDVINVCVPTGNFGNILAAYYAKKMGLPLGKLICASNSNNVLSDFINTGSYNRNRTFFATISPSMDILISSNLERLLFDLYDLDSQDISRLMEELSKNGTYTLSTDVMDKLKQSFFGGYCSEEETKDTISSLYKQFSYVCDTHTAVAVKVYDDYVKATGDMTKTLIVSTASPFKFSGDVLPCIDELPLSSDEFEVVERLADLSTLEIPVSLSQLQNKMIRFGSVIDKSDMKSVVCQKLGI